MTREEFIKELEYQGYTYKEEGNKIIITKESRVLYLDSIKDLPSNVVFMNSSTVYLTDLKTLPEGIMFSNIGEVWLNSLQTIPKGIVFSNSRGVYLRSLIGGWFNMWEGNIKGIGSNRLLNKMIELELFDR